jgi:hypothetical protein
MLESLSPDLGGKLEAKLGNAPFLGRFQAIRVVRLLLRSGPDASNRGLKLHESSFLSFKASLFPRPRRQRFQLCSDPHFELC